MVRSSSSIFTCKICLKGVYAIFAFIEHESTHHYLTFRILCKEEDIFVTILGTKTIENNEWRKEKNEGKKRGKEKRKKTGQVERKEEQRTEGKTEICLWAEIETVLFLLSSILMVIWINKPHQVYIWLLQNIELHLSFMLHLKTVRQNLKFTLTDTNS